MAIALGIITTILIIYALCSYREYVFKATSQRMPVNFQLIPIFSKLFTMEKNMSELSLKVEALKTEVAELSTKVVAAVEDLKGKVAVQATAIVDLQAALAVEEADDAVLQAALDAALASNADVVAAMADLDVVTSTIDALGNSLEVPVVPPVEPTPEEPIV